MSIAGNAFGSLAQPEAVVEVEVRPRDLPENGKVASRARISENVSIAISR